ncbi:hypothetical protein PR048_031114 [Dryococelus australis]|uniref:Uncharacterized protein n=1 Tax=Dryococelus australis TaxID=614101 RepID=A0ABQ9G7H3_9NEOP|nr:hypothetical protein PR048_031114 [Dryococelus australis]
MEICPPWLMSHDNNALFKLRRKRPATRAGIQEGMDVPGKLPVTRYFLLHKLKTQNLRLKTQKSGPKTQHSRLKTLDTIPMTQDPRHKTQEPRSNTQDSKLHTQDSRLKTLNPRPKTEDPRIKTQDPCRRGDGQDAHLKKTSDQCCGRQGHRISHCGTFFCRGTSKNAPLPRNIADLREREKRERERERERGERERERESGSSQRHALSTGSCRCETDNNSIIAVYAMNICRCYEYGSSYTFILHCAPILKEVFRCSSAQHELLGSARRFQAAIRRCLSSPDMTQDPRMERHWNARAGKQQYREKIQHDSHVRKSGSELAVGQTQIATVGGERPSHCATAPARLPPRNEPGSIPGWVAPGFSHVGIVPDNAAGRRVFSVISRFPRPFHSGAAPYSPQFAHVGSQDLDVKSRPSLSGHSLTDQSTGQGLSSETHCWTHNQPSHPLVSRPSVFSSKQLECNDTGMDLAEESQYDIILLCQTVLLSVE